MGLESKLLDFSFFSIFVWFPSIKSLTPDTNCFDSSTRIYHTYIQFKILGFCIVENHDDILLVLRLLSKTQNVKKPTIFTSAMGFKVVDQLENSTYVCVVLKLNSFRILLGLRNLSSHKIFFL